MVESPRIDSVSKAVAEVLLQSGAVSIDTEKQFVYTSGIISPIYTDNRILLSFPEYRRRVVTLLTQRLLQSHSLDQFDVLAGVATAGISWAALLADRLDKPMVYVRSAAKEHGKQQQIEGRLNPGERAIVIEDLISTGGSLIDAAEGIRESEGNVVECLALFTYELPQATANFQQHDLPFQTLSRISDLLAVAIDDRIITTDQSKIVEAWMESRSNS